MGLIVLEVGLLGAAGLVVLAAQRLTNATLLERPGGEAAAVADSLSSYGGGGSGRAVRGDWEVVWEEGGGGTRVLRARLLEASGAAPLAEMWLP